MDDLLLKELGNLARRQEEAERARLDERWDRLAAGTLTAEEETELRALAISSPEAGEAYVAFKPLGAEFQARVARKINSPSVAPAPQPVPLPFWRRIEVRVIAAVAVAVTVGVGVYRRIPPPPQPPVLHPTVQVIGGDKATRGSDSGPASGTPVFSPGSMLELQVHLQPPQKTQDLEVHAFRVPAGREKEPWVSVSGFNIDKGANGVIRLRGEVGEQIQLPVGLWRVCIAISRPGKAPQEGELPAALPESHTDWQAICTESLRVKDSS